MIVFIFLEDSFKTEIQCSLPVLNIKICKLCHHS